MKTIAKLATIMLASLGASMIPGFALAQVTAPASGNYSGMVSFQQSLAFNCNLGLTVDATANTVAVSLKPGNLACASLSFVGNPYSYTFDPVTGDFTAIGVYIQPFFPNDCAGNLTAVWDDAAQEFLISAILPPAGGTVPCHIEGAAS